MAIDIEINPKLKPIDAAELMTCKSQLEELDETLSLTELNKKQFLPEDSPAAMLSFIDTMRSSIMQQRNMLISSMKNIGLGESISEDMISGLKQGIAFLSTNVETLFTTSGKVGKVFSSIPKEMAKDFAAEFTDLSRSASSIITQTYRSMGPQTNNAYEAILNANAPFKKGAGALAGRFGLSDKQMSDLLQGVINMVSPTFAREDYYQSAIDLSRGTLKRFAILPEYATYKERMPEKYRNFPDVPKSVPFSVGSRRKAYQGNMSEDDYTLLRAAASKYPALENALTMAGVAYRGTINGKAGQLIMPSSPIKEAEYAVALGFLDRDILRPALEGAPMHRHSLLNSDDYEQLAMARKTSRTPTEVFGALRDLSSISVSQPLYLDKPRKYSRSIANSDAVDSTVSIRPDYYQIMSLTLDDLMNGVILDDKAGREFAYNNKAAGKSVNRIISSSIYTKLLGMSGHNSFGSESGPRKMLQLDLTDRLFEKKENGDLVFENGKVKANADTMAFVAKLFDEKNGKTVTTPGGNTFSYPVIQHGKNGTYVPTGIHKNGIIDLAEESAYLEVASKFIDKYGVDIFKNLVNDDEEFTTVKDLNKPIDARNRLHTPAVPFSSLGGRMPSMKETAFVDFNSITGFDGGMIVMPGYLPAKAMTVRSAGFKGSAAQVDFHKMIKDVYGDVSEFMVPTWNAPQEMKELYRKKGISAVRDAYKQQGLKSFDEDFVDLLKYQAAIDVSMNKTPFYKGLKHSAIQERFFDVLDMIGGMYGVETDKEFLSKTDSISRQVTQNLDLTPDEIKENNKKWNNYINTLRTNPMKTIDMLFTDPDDPLSQRIQKDKSLFFSDPEARKRVDDAIWKAVDDRENQRLFSKGDALNALAINNPFELISSIARSNNLKPQNTHLAKALSLKGKGNADAVALAAWADTLEMGGWRYPNNLGEQFELLNSKEYIDMLDAYQMSRDAMIVNMDTIKKMGGGDIDGDTIQAVRNKLAETVRRTYETRGIETQKLKTTVQTPEDLPLTSDGKSRKVEPSDYADILYRKAASVFEMAAVSNASDALAQGNWLDPEWAKFARQAGVDLRAMYDIDTTFAKTGVLANWSHVANQARNMGTPYVRMFKDLQGAVEEGDFSRVKDFSQVNFPSRFSNLTVSALAAGIDTPYSNNVIESFIQAQEQLQGIKQLESSGNPIDLAHAQYLRKNNEVMAQIASHRAQFVSRKDEGEMIGLLANWEALVNTELQKTKINEPNNEEKINHWLDQLRDVKFQRGRQLHLKNFGLTEDARDRNEGFIPYSGIAKGRVTGEAGVFNQVYDAEQDALKAKISTITGADEAILAAQRSKAEQVEAANRIQKMLNRPFSWSQLHGIEKETAGPLNWYKKYVASEDYQKEPTTPLQLLGSALHKTQEHWATRRMANNNDYGTPEEMVQFLNDYLTKWRDPDTHQKLFPELPTDDNLLYDEHVKARYKEVIEAAKQYPTLFRDQKIVGVEEHGGVVHPNVGTDKTGKHLNSIGYIDVVTEDENGIKTNWDLKHSFDHDRSLTGIHKYDQPVLYAGANGAQKVGLISYEGGKLATQSVDVTPEMVSSVEQRMSKITSSIIPLMEKQDILGEILNGYFDPVLLPNAIKGTKRPTTPAPGAPVSDNYLLQTAATAGLPVSSSAIPVQIAQPSLDEQTTAFSNREYIDEQIERYEKTQNQLLAKELGYDKTRPTRSQWDNYENMYSERGYMDAMTRMRNRGASPNELALFQTSFHLGQEQYYKTLQAAAPGEMANFSESIAEKIYTHGTTGYAKNILTEQKRIDEEFDKSQAAYNLLLNKENKTKEDEQAIQKAADQLSVTSEIKKEYEKLLSADAESSLRTDISKLTATAMGKNVTDAQKVALQVASFAKNKTQIETSLGNLHQNGIVSDEVYKELSELLSNTTAENYKKELENEIAQQTDLRNTKNNISYNRFMRQGDQLRRNRYGGSRSFAARALSIHENALTQQENRLITATQMRMDQEKVVEQKRNTADYGQEVAKLNELKNAEAAARAEMEQLSKQSVTVGDVFASIGQSAQMLARRLGRQLFQKALQETKRFIKEFDASMNEIQAITLKSNNEMASVRSGTINRAIGLRTSVSNVANTEAALYRQGLNDQEVAARTESIIKFATVTKLNVQEATKIITTALQNDLVGSATEAMDALVALGDSAATTAAEIGKGMQKAAASAKVAGVSYSELTALLTIGTSDTQLSGTQVGTALQTVFSRMRRLSVSGWASDQNGEKTTASDAEAALKTVGVDLWDDKALGKMRSAYDVLRDLSKVWQNLSDAQKNIVMNAMAGTRQTNVFSTLMEGMSEDGGATLDKYLGLAEGSEGVTQSKYEIAMQSLAASMDTLKSSWDSVVESFVSGGSITGILDGVSGFLQMFANSGNIAQGMSLVAGGITGIGVAIAALTSSNPAIKALSTILGLASGLIVGGGITGIASLIHVESDEERKARESQEAWNSVQSNYSYSQADKKSWDNAIAEVEKAGKAWKGYEDSSSTDNLYVSLQNLSNAFPAVSESVQKAIADLNNWTKAVDDAKNKADELSKGSIQTQIDKITGYLDEYTQQNYEAAMKGFTSKADLKNAKEYLAEGVEHQGDIWGYGGGLMDEYGKFVGLGYALDTDKLMASDDNRSKAKALVYGYRNNESFRKIANQIITNEELLSQLNGATSADDLVKNVSFQARASEELSRIIKQSEEVNPLSLDILADDLGVSTQGLINGETPEGLTTEKAFYRLATKNENVRTWLQQNKPEQYSALFDENGNPTRSFEEMVRNPNEYQRNAIDGLYNKLIADASYGDEAYKAKRKNAALAFFKEDLGSRMPFEQMATDEYNADFLKNIFLNSLEKSDIVDENGNYSKENLNAFVNNFLAGWLDDKSLKSFVRDNSKYSDFEYHIDKNDPNTWFNNYESAIQYIRDHNLGYDQLKDKNDNSAYQTADKLVAAKRQESRTNNRQILLDDILNGYSDVSGFRSMTEAERQEVVRSRNRSGLDAQNDYRALLKGNRVAPLSKFIEEGKTLEDYKQAFKNIGSDADLAKAVSSNYTALLGWITNDINLVFQGLNEELNGESTAASQAEAMRSVLDKLSENRGELITLVETDFEETYKSILSYFGEENGKAIFSSMRNGTYKGSDWEKLVNRTLAENSLRPDAGLTQYSQREIADLASQAMSSEFGSLAEFAKYQGWTKSQYEAVKNAYGAEIDRYKNMTETQRTNIEGLNLKRDFDVKIAVAGIDDLESANKVLQGTTQLIENLKKGGEFEIKAKLQMETDNYNFEQQVAKLENGTPEEQIDALMSFNPNRTRAWIVENQDEAKANANRQIQLQREQTAAQFSEMARTMGLDYATEEAKKQGYELAKSGMTSDEALNELNKYYSDQFYKVDENGNIYFEAGGQKISAGEYTQDKFNSLMYSGFEHVGGTQDIDREDLAFGLQRSKTPYEIEQAQRVILSGDTNSINKLRNDNNELYNQAFNGLTQNQKDYLAARATVQSMNGHYNDYTQKEFDDAVNAMYGLQTAAYADFGYKTRDEIYNAASLYNPITNPQFYDDYASIVGSDIAERTKDQNYTLTSQEQNYAQMLMDNYGKGINGLTDVQKILGANSMLSSIAAGTYEQEFGNASEDMVNSYSGAVEGMQDLIKAYQEGTLSSEDFAEMQKDVNAALKSALFSAQNYGEGIDDVSKSLQALAKGGKTARQELVRINEAAYDTQDAMTAWQDAYNGGNVKSGAQLSKEAREVISKRTGASVKAVQKWTAKEMENLFANDATKQDINNEMGTYVDTLLNDAIADIQEQVGDISDWTKPIDIGGTVAIICNPDGSINMDGLIALANAAQSDAIGVLEALAQGKLAEWVATLKTENANGKFRAWIESKTTTLGKGGRGGGGGSYNNRSGGGGGGGGGKSATDKLLEKQKQRISEIEHQSKMLEIQEKYLDFTNDYSGYSSNIDQQIANQERLRSAYAQSIQELKNQLATLERGSDDWNKANEQLMQYEENLENIKNTINDLGAKRITIVEQKQENEDRRGSHNLNMLSKMAARYQKSGQFESYEGIMEQTIEETRKQIHLNDKQITEWENLLKTFTENSDSWIQTRDKIWAMREENAELQNQMASDLIDLQEARISQIAEDLQNQKAPLEHRANMLDTYGQMYESVNDFTKYRGTLEGTIDTNRQMKEMTDAAIAQVKKQIDGMRESDPARQSAIQTLYELEEASAQYEASILSNQQAIEESLISELTQAHQDSGSILEHELKLLSEAEKEFTRNDDFINYENILEEKARNASDRLKDQQNALEDYLALQNSGKITEGGQQWRELEDTIRSTKENVASLRNEWQEALQAIEKAKFTNLKETFAETYDLSQHQQKLVQYDQTRYQNNGQLTNYGTALEWEGKILEDQRDSIQNHIKDLEEQLQESKEFPELYKEITKEIMTWEEKLADTNNRIEKNTELIEKNQDAIRKARIAVENEADKAIRAWIQKQRNMLSATVTMQNNIFAIISKNYQQQWALEQKTLDKKKQTLNEEKNLINERVNFRKKMMDQEAKDEELAEYRRQLALISQDTTRTREANELRRKIQDMEKEQAMQNAQDIANAEIQSLNDQSKAIDDYAATYQENLTELLSNINNFKDIIDGLLSGSFEDFVNWNAEYNEDFKKSSDEQRQQLINGWEDTWYTMLGQLRTYWDQVDESMQSRDGFLELLKTQDEYLKLSETGQASYLYRAGELWDAFDATKVDDATFSDNHEIIDTINDLKDWTFNVNIAGLGNYDFGGSISDYVYNRDRSVIPYEYDSDYKGVGYVAPPPAPAPAPTSSSGGGGSGNSGSSSPAPAKKKWAYSYTFNGQNRSERTESYSADTARKFAEAEIVSAANYLAKNSTPGMAETIRRQQVAAMNSIKVWQYKKGGLVDYTGLAMVHGTPSKPEAFLSAEDRANMRAMLDAFAYVKAPTMTHIDPSIYGTTTNNYGDVNITINEAKIDNDQDISALAQKIGKEFTKELSKSGFNTASYAW